MDKLSEARRIVGVLTSQITDTQNKLESLVETRERVAFSALIEKDEKAQQRLDYLNEQDVNLQREQTALRAALRTAESRLVDAEREVLASANAERETERRKRLMALSDRAVELDRMANDFVSACAAFQNEATAIGRLGTGPSAQLVRVATQRALTSHLQATGLPLQIIPPAQRRTFTSLAQSWIGAVAKPEDTATAA